MVFNSCVKDQCRRTYQLYSPVYKSLSQVRAGMKSDAASPLINPGKLYIYNNFIFLNERDKGIHVIDNTVASAPRNIAFINIPGNQDLVVSGSTLYADSYTDLVTFDITDPLNAVTKDFKYNVFPHRGNYVLNRAGTDNPDEIQVVVGYTTRDTSEACDCGAELISDAAPGGRGGSMARFTLKGNYLYTVTTSNLNVFDVSSPQEPVFKHTQGLGWNIETIFPFGQNLFIGSTTGMFIYDIQDPAVPVQQGQFTHARSCDPVVTDGKYAYVTLRSGANCPGSANQLEVLDVQDLKAPKLVQTYPLNSPFGLSKDDNLLFICDGTAGLKVFDATDPASLQPLQQLTGFFAYDVIAYNNQAIVVTLNGLYQFNYFNTKNIQLVSKLLIGQ